MFCYSDLSYNPSSSFAQWPSQAYKVHETLCFEKENIIDKISFIILSQITMFLRSKETTLIFYFNQNDTLSKLGPSIEKMWTDPTNPEKYRDNLLKIEIYFEEFNRELIRDLPAYGVRKCVRPLHCMDTATSLETRRRLHLKRYLVENCHYAQETPKMAIFVG